MFGNSFKIIAKQRDSCLREKTRSVVPNDGFLCKLECKCTLTNTALYFVSGPPIGLFKALCAELLEHIIRDT